MVHVGACVEYGQTQVQSSHMLNVNRCMIDIYMHRDFERKSIIHSKSSLLSTLDIICYNGSGISSSFLCEFWICPFACSTHDKSASDKSAAAPGG
jgi:hypothetical protein